MAINQADEKSRLNNFGFSWKVARSKNDKERVQPVHLSPLLLFLFLGASSMRRSRDSKLGIVWKYAADAVPIKRGRGYIAAGIWRDVIFARSLGLSSTFETRGIVSAPRSRTQFVPFHQGRHRDASRGKALRRCCGMHANHIPRGRSRGDCAGGGKGFASRVGLKRCHVFDWLMTDSKGIGGRWIATC